MKNTEKKTTALWSVAAGKDVNSEQMGQTQDFHLWD